MDSKQELIDWVNKHDGYSYTDGDRFDIVTNNYIIFQIDNNHIMQSLCTRLFGEQVDPYRVVLNYLKEHIDNKNKLLRLINIKNDYSYYEDEDYLVIKYLGQTFASVRKNDPYITESMVATLVGKHDNPYKVILDNLSNINATGKKYDNGKLRFDLLPKECMQDLYSRCYRPEELVLNFIYSNENWSQVFYHTMRYICMDCSLTWEEAITELCKIITYGANKYEPNNWQQVERDRYVAAYLRHYYAHVKGERNDEESGHLHLAHAACNAMFILWKDKYE